jgi:hypothetical protein
MQKTPFVIASLAWAISIIFTTLSFSDELKPIKLPNPQVEGGRPLMQALKDRSSSRSFSSEKLPLQVLSNLLWAAFGINRPDAGKRTAPSAMNRQEIDIYVAIIEGLYLYDAKAQTLKPVLSEDIRSVTGRQDFLKDAPINLIYVADFARMDASTKEDKEIYSAADVGLDRKSVV